MLLRLKLARLAWTEVPTSMKWNRTSQPALAAWRNLASDTMTKDTSEQALKGILFELMP